MNAKLIGVQLRTPSSSSKRFLKYLVSVPGLKPLGESPDGNTHLQAGNYRINVSSVPDNKFVEANKKVSLPEITVQTEDPRFVDLLQQFNTEHENILYFNLTSSISPESLQTDTPSMKALKESYEDRQATFQELLSKHNNDPMIAQLSCFFSPDELSKMRASHQNTRELLSRSFPHLRSFFRNYREPSIEHIAKYVPSTKPNMVKDFMKLFQNLGFTSVQKREVEKRKEVLLCFQRETNKATFLSPNLALIIPSSDDSLSATLSEGSFYPDHASFMSNFLFTAYQARENAEKLGIKFLSGGLTALLIKENYGTTELEAELLERMGVAFKIGEKENKKGENRQIESSGGGNSFMAIDNIFTEHSVSDEKVTYPPEEMISKSFSSASS